MSEKKIEIKCSGTKNIRLETFKELQGNLKELSKANYEKLKSSILKYGFSFPVFCYKQKETHWILDAHQRVKTLKLLQEDGYYIPDLPTVFIEAKDKREAKEKLLQLNSNYGKFTDEGLYEFMNEPNFEIDVNFLKEIDLPDFDLEKFELGYFKEQDEEKLNDVPELQEKAVSKLGDLFLIDGKHRVLCGDSTKEESYKVLFEGKKADMIFTDPPYGIEIVGKNGKVGADKLAKNQVYSEVIGDNTTDTAKRFYETCIKIGFNKFILWGGNYFLDFLPFSYSWVIWDKRGEMNSNNFADGEMAWVSFHSRVRIYKQVWAGMIREGEKEKRVHPTQKPIETLKNILNDFTKEKEIIYDGFLGSGSTLIACEQTNRICYGIELDEHYIDVILRRYKKLYPECKIECLNREYNFNELFKDNEKG